MTVTAPAGVSDPGPGVVSGTTAQATTGGPTPVIDVKLGRATALERIELSGAAAGGRFLASVREPMIAARSLGVALRRLAWLSRPVAVTSTPPGVDVRATW